MFNMRKTFIIPSASLIRSTLCTLLLVAVAGINHLNAQVTFTRGLAQTLTVCENSSGIGIDSLLKINDGATGLTEHWYVTTAPGHGSLSLSSYFAASTGGDITPSGWSYSPAAGYTGTDVFSVIVSNGTDSQTTTVTVTINPQPAVSPITGTTTQCVTGSATLSNATTGGVWFSTNPSVASINAASGAVRGVATGIVSIVYTTTNIYGCQNAAFTYDTVITVPTVATTSGSSSVCIGSTTTLTNATPSGTWSSGSPSIASVNSSGVVTGVAAGTANITYSVTNICGTSINVFPITVNSSGVSPISPSTPVSVCIGATTTLTDATTGGTWSSATPSVATINAAGVVTGLSVGSATIVYSVTNSCGVINQFKTVSVITVPEVPGVIGGASSVCISTSTTLTDTTAGGVWSSSASSIASINPTTGVVFGRALGSATIFYTVTNTCGSTSQSTSFSVVTVPASPAAISGTFTICEAASTTLGDATGGGVWSISNPAIATIDSNTGVMTGISAGSAAVTYTVFNACGSNFITQVININAVPPLAAAIGGTPSTCISTSSPLTNSTPGGT
ncbi:MAG: hypothetical protein EBZ77_12740, partial [Chitinophagia bacterium]|nr:hypothetical protein [Chitinophagia bacterium]